MYDDLNILIIRLCYIQGIIFKDLKIPPPSEMKELDCFYR